MPRISGIGIRPRPAPGRPRCANRAAAFTLIEVLVVVAITGIILAVASVNLFPSDAQLARRESGMVALAVERARDAAWLGGRPTSVTFDEGRVRSGASQATRGGRSATRTARLEAACKSPASSWTASR